MDGPSEHLSWAELQCKDGVPYPDKWRKDRAIQLAIVFENIRGLYGKPIRVNSAYRTPVHNASIGGARNSQHVQGKALDLEPPRGITIDQFYRDIKSRSKIFGIRGIGRYTTFVHVDIRDSDRLIVWHGDGIKDSQT